MNLDRWPLPLQLLVLELARAVAPLVCIFYREGWFNTPDDLSSPHGQYEPKMRGILQRFGPRVNDWWWLGVRNRAYGLAYAMKPRELRGLWSYNGHTITRYQEGRIRVTTVEQWTERAISFGWFHVLVGYRVTPIWNEIRENRRRKNLGEPPIPFRPINMDGRPILSFRSGAPD